MEKEDVIRLMAAQLYNHVLAVEVGPHVADKAAIQDAVRLYYGVSIQNVRQG